jgi:2-C-methyl-D-erythritol 4-phosphate cytidylyltransferase / 2-C-methyl-D-erythritol 2,4-cyclodiphosphate synthase
VTRTAAIIVAAGRGERCGGGVPKQFAPLGGRPMLDWSIAAFTRHPAIDEVLVVLPEGEPRDLPVRSVTGGATRRQSVANGLAALGDADRVLIHDAARPFPPAAVIDRLVAALDTAEGAVPVLPVADTLAEETDALGPIVPREALRRIQTPQAFRRESIEAAHRDWSGGEATDDSQMVRALGGRVALVQGDAMLEKVTYPEDFARAEAMLPWETRSASGFDVHRLVDGEELWLGGVLIPHTQGLSGHSDADVALHAITDAVLGTIAAGDIGQHFPPSDPQWRGAASDQFLRHAIELVQKAGGQLTFVDVTLICEAPKIGPHREAIRARIAEICGLDASRVSVKATTTERLGFTGRGEGIAAQATATVRVPGWRP